MKVSLTSEYIHIIGLENLPKISKRALLERIGRKIRKGGILTYILGGMCTSCELHKNIIVKKIFEYDKRIQKLKKHINELFFGYKLTKLEKRYFKYLFLTNLNKN